MTPQNVECLPIGIDGLQLYILNNTSNGKTTGLEDGRKWKKSCPTDWLGHRRVRFADCKGSHKCTNESCPFKVQFGVINTRQFEKNKALGLICKGCGMKAGFVRCFARRYISTSNKQTKVYHYGTHTCPITKPVVKNTAQVSQILKNNPNIKPSEIQSSCILAAFREGADWKKVEKEVEATLDRNGFQI